MEFDLIDIFTGKNITIDCLDIRGLVPPEYICDVIVEDSEVSDELSPEVAK